MGFRHFVKAAFLIAALSLAACAPTIQRAQVSPASFEGPRFDVAAGRFISFDGAPLGLSAWAPKDEAPWAVIVALHGMNDYGEAFYLAGPYWAQHGVATYAYDARGQGRSPQRGVWGGQKLMLEDVRTAVRLARARYPNATIAVVGDSMGAATAMSAFGSDDPPPADRLVLVAPAVWGWSTLPKSYAATLWLGAHTLGARPVTPPKGVQRRIVASDNNAMLQKIGRDPNMLFTTRIDAIYGLVGMMERASDSAADLKVPTAFLYGAKDQIIPRASAEKAARQLPPTARTAIYPNGYHMLLRDLQAKVVWDDVLAFVRDAAAPFPSNAATLIPARTSLTKAP
jgi:alpha-beta hydrolase superfamily lysophospholipase